MFRQMSWLFVMVLLAGCATSSTVKRTEPVTIVLENGDRIEAHILDVWRDKVVFEATDWEKAYEYGEVLQTSRIRGIELKSGELLSVEDFRAYRKGDLKIEAPEEGEQPVVAQATKESEALPEGTENLQYEVLKNKPISEMTENEFKYFLMMKKKELAAAGEDPSAIEAFAGERERAARQESESPLVKKQATDIVIRGQSKPAPEQPASGVGRGSTELGLKLPVRPAAPAPSTPDPELQAVAESLIEAGVAAGYLAYARGKAELSPAERALMQAIEASPGWQEQLEEFDYLTGVAKRALERAHLYNPEGMREKLGLEFDPNLEMEFTEFMDQLHRRLGEDVQMGDFRAMVEVLGEGGARAVRKLLENYGSWKLALSERASTAVK